MDSPENEAPVGLDDQSTPDAAESEAQSEPEVDAESLRSAVAAAGEQAGLLADIAALKRMTGRMPDLQKRLGEVEKAATKLSQLEASIKRFDALLDSLDGIVPDRALADLRPRDDSSNAELRQQMAELRAQLEGRESDDGEGRTPEQAAWEARWDAATRQVNAYAEKYGFTEADIPQAEWQKAYTANTTLDRQGRVVDYDASAAAIDVIKYIDRERAARERRAEKKDAGSGGVEGSRSPRTGQLTIDQMRRMTAKELMAIPKEERDAALAAANS